MFVTKSLLLYFILIILSNFFSSNSFILHFHCVSCFLQTIWLNWFDAHITCKGFLLQIRVGLTLRHTSTTVKCNSILKSCQSNFLNVILHIDDARCSHRIYALHNYYCLWIVHNMICVEHWARSILYKIRKIECLWNTYHMNSVFEICNQLIN